MLHMHDLQVAQLMQGLLLLRRGAQKRQFFHLNDHNFFNHELFEFARNLYDYSFIFEIGMVSEVDNYP